MTDVFDLRAQRFAFGAVAATCGCAVALWTATARADDRAVIAPETPVRSAPFDVAPELARLHAGDRVHGDDQAQGVWRRIALPDGRYGFVHDTDTEHSTIPVPALAPAPVAATAGVGPAAAAAAAASPSGQPAPVIVQAPPASSAQPAEPHLLGVMFELLPVGTLSGTNPNGDSFSGDMAFGVAVAPFFDAGVSPYFAIGVSPQAIFRVKGDGAAGESAKEFDFRARLTGRLPLSPRARVFARLSPAYSLISVPSPPAGSNAATLSNPKGFQIGFAVGVEVAVLPKLFVVTDLGYQAGFQSSDVGDRHTSYLHLGAGFAVGL